MSKYRAVKTTIDGITFDSKKEASRYLQLKEAEKAGEIEDLQLQVAYDLLPTMKICGKTQRKVRYIADFTYIKKGQLVVEDVKGMKTDVYKLKRRLMKFIHNIEVQEI